MSKEPEDLGKNVDGVDGICAVCHFTKSPFNEHVLYDCKLGVDDCIPKAKMLYRYFFPDKIIVPMQEFQNFIPAQP